MKKKQTQNLLFFNAMFLQVVGDHISSQLPLLHYVEIITSRESAGVSLCLHTHWNQFS